MLCDETIEHTADILIPHGRVIILVGCVRQIVFSIYPWLILKQIAAFSKQERDAAIFAAFVSLIATTEDASLLAITTL